MYAIIEESGAQRKVQQGEEILIDLVNDGDIAVGQQVTFDRVLVVGEPGGTAAAATAKLGMPYVAGATVTAEVVAPIEMGEKLHIFKFRPKKGYKRKTGHRQRYTKVRITGIAG